MKRWLQWTARQNLVIKLLSIVLIAIIIGPIISFSDKYGDKWQEALDQIFDYDNI